MGTDSTSGGHLGEQAGRQIPVADAAADDDAGQLQIRCAGARWQAGRRRGRIGADLSTVATRLGTSTLWAWGAGPPIAQPMPYAPKQRGVIDTVLAANRISRDERVVVQSFMSAPYLLPGSDLIFTTTRHFAHFYAKLLPLAIACSPTAAGSSSPGTDGAAPLSLPAA